MTVLTDSKGFAHYACPQCEVGEYMFYPQQKDPICWLCGGPMRPMSARELGLFQG